jgi:hypothetical protein
VLPDGDEKKDEIMKLIVSMHLVVLGASRQDIP